MSYLIFARKFRPQTFEQVLGQDPIVTTLRNGIKQERIPQNFLFSGPRGIGKTSTARILAKALNCAKGPVEEPCGKCTSCQEITQGNSLDVLEIDGASNRGIDEIRNLRETVKFKPVNGRYKIYIIDEVHMLTTEAFNALLKTLEEPPPHVKFIFATTESHKVPLTILSRCQRFTFKRIPTHVIAEKLEEIAKAEKLKFDKKAIYLVAKASEGALRDAESLLDQLASFSEGKIEEADVLATLGLASEEVYFSILAAIQSKEAEKIFSLVADLYDNGKDLSQFAKGLLETFRHLLLLQCTDKADSFIEMSEEGITGLKKYTKAFSRGELLLALSLLGNLQQQLRRNITSPRLLIETTLLKLLHIEGLQPLEGDAAPAPAKIVSKPVSLPPQQTPPAYSSKPAKSAAKNDMSLEDSGAVEATLNEIESCWPRVIDYVKTKRMSVGIFLSESEPVEVAGSLVTLGLPTEFQFHKEMLDRDVNRQLVEEAFQVICQKKIKLRFVTTSVENEKVEQPEQEVLAPAPSGKSGTAGTSGPEASDNRSMPEIITQAMDIFPGAKIIRKT